MFVEASLLVPVVYAVNLLIHEVWSVMTVLEGGCVVMGVRFKSIPLVRRWCSFISFGAPGIGITYFSILTTPEYDFASHVVII